MQHIKLYTTAGCHLCEEAEAMFLYLVNNQLDTKQLQLQKIEISENDNLIETYGIRIPVLSNELSELGWPFSFDELKTWLDNKK